MAEEQKKEEQKKEEQKPDTAAELAALKASNAELQAKLSEFNKKKEDDPGLLDKARKEQEERNKKNLDTKALENALKFTMRSEEFLKTNSSLLPKDVDNIFKIADKENYGNAIEKESAIKSGVIQSFFSVQANMDLLTESQKTSLDEYLKLTKDGKQDKAQATYANIFEPTFEMLKRVKKAEALSKGHAPEGDEDLAYKNKMMKHSRSHFLGEK